MRRYELKPEPGCVTIVNHSACREGKDLILLSDLTLIDADTSKRLDPSEIPFGSGWERNDLVSFRIEEL